MVIQDITKMDFLLISGIKAARRANINKLSTNMIRMQCDKLPDTMQKNTAVTLCDPSGISVHNGELVFKTSPKFDVSKVIVPKDADDVYTLTVINVPSYDRPLEQENVILVNGAKHTVDMEIWDVTYFLVGLWAIVVGIYSIYYEGIKLIYESLPISKK